MTISCICSPAPLKGRNTKVCMWGEIPDVITPVKFYVDRFRRFFIHGGLKIGVFHWQRESPCTAWRWQHGHCECHITAPLCRCVKLRERRVISRLCPRSSLFIAHVMSLLSFHSMRFVLVVTDLPFPASMSLLYSGMPANYTLKILYNCLF